MLNVGVNQTCAVYEVPYRGVQMPGKIREIYLAAMEEARACANAEGIDLTEEDVKEWVRVVDGLDPEGEPSMRQDTKAGRQTEIGLFGETVREIARRHHIPVPWNDSFCEKLGSLA